MVMHSSVYLDAMIARFLNATVEAALPSIQGRIQDFHGGRGGKVYVRSHASRVGPLLPVSRALKTALEAVRY